MDEHEQKYDENGYPENSLLIPNFLVDAFMRTPLSRSENAIIFLLCRETFGRNQYMVRITLREFADKIGIARENVSKVLKKLIEKGVITRTGDPQKPIYAIHQNVSDWKIPG